MLVLSRVKGETIVIGDGIRVRVLSVQGGRVSIGIDAPRSLTILREELAHTPVDTGTEPGRRRALPPRSRHARPHRAAPVKGGVA